MTHPTRTIVPILLNDMVRIGQERSQDFQYTKKDVARCIRNVTTIQLHETLCITESLKVKCYYAGHVLGACMFSVTATVNGISETVVYTGDYNMTPDRHLGSAWIDKCCPDLLITECTYATTIRESKRRREADFLSRVNECVNNGGKVLVPVFALGRAQELLILLNEYWKRIPNLSNIPIYFSAGMTERANEYYKLFVGWTNEHIKSTFVESNPFDFIGVKTWKTENVDDSSPCVLLASPGMLHAGTSLQVFKKWCDNPKNMVIMPGSLQT